MNIIHNFGVFSTIEVMASDRAIFIYRAFVVFEEGATAFDNHNPAVAGFGEFSSEFS
jgi:hypothetical protein